MKKEIAMKWADALESGEYDQGKHALHARRNEFCCLGVLCDISKLGDWESGFNANGYVPKRHTAGLGGALVLPDFVQAWSGLTSNKGEFTGAVNDESLTLTRLNDRGVPFTKIAKYIRKYYDKL